MNKIIHENIEAWLLDYSEGNLSGEDKEQLERFLESNPQYKELLSEYDTLLTLTDESDEVFDKKHLLYADMMKIRQHNTLMMRKNKVLKRTLAFVSSIAAIIILLFIIIKPQNNTTVPQIAKTDNHSVSEKQYTIAKDNPVVKTKQHIADKEYHIINTESHTERTIPHSELADNPIEEQEQRYDALVRKNGDKSYELEQLICLVRNTWSDAPEKVLRKDGNELQMIYVNNDNTVRGSVNATMLSYPDNSVIRYVNNTPQTECVRYANPYANPNREIVIRDVTLKELDSIMKILQNR